MFLVPFNIGFYKCIDNIPRTIKKVSFLCKVLTVALNDGTSGIALNHPHIMGQSWASSWIHLDMDLVLSVRSNVEQIVEIVSTALMGWVMRDYDLTGPDAHESPQCLIVAGIVGQSNVPIVTHRVTCKLAVGQ